jgi:hypothetical protein
VLKPDGISKAEAAYQILKAAGFRAYLGTKHKHIVSVIGATARQINFELERSMHEPLFRLSKVSSSVITLNFKTRS